VTLAQSSRVRPKPSVRTDNERLLDQLAGISAWLQARADSELQLVEAGSREMRLDRARRLDVMRRQHCGLVQATERQLRESGSPLRSTTAPRVVIVHRNDWFKDKVSSGLREGGIHIVAELVNGAEAVGLVVAEQPDVLLVEDKLPMLGALDVLAEVRRFAPKTRVVVQVGTDSQIGAFLETGPCTVFTRRIPPADIVDGILDLLSPGA
jgi:CheY-like chemotaxis protein